jgi:hypothetical protein
LKGWIERRHLLFVAHQRLIEIDCCADYYKVNAWGKAGESATELDNGGVKSHFAYMYRYFGAEIASPAPKLLHTLTEEVIDNLTFFQLLQVLCRRASRKKKNDKR